MSARTKARKRALDMLFSADVRGIGADEALSAEAVRALREPEREASWVYAREIVQGVIDHSRGIDDAIGAHAQGWTLERMPAVDRALLRVATWEILHNDEVPAGVAIDEAVEVAKTLSTDESPAFVNGVLAAIARSATGA